MNTLRESRSVSPRLPLSQANPFNLPFPPSALPGLRAKFNAFARALDLAPVKYKLVQDKHWTPDRANRVEPRYKAFLFLIGSQVRAEFVPTFDIDEMWHAHILDTRKYMADCAQHFGAYIHHYPYLGMKDAEDRSRAEGLFATTCASIAGVFGIDVHDLDATSCGSGCGHGCGGHGCGGGHSSCGAGHSDTGTHGDHGGHHDHNDSDSGYSGCSSNADAERKRRAPPVPNDPTGDPERKPGIWRRIFGLSPDSKEAEWYASVTPELFESEFRPDATLLDGLGGKVN